MIPEVIGKVIEGHDLSESEMTGVMNQIMSGEATPAQIGSFITALRMKGETVDEITGGARVMREKAVKIKTSSPRIVDTCGTGGDGANTFNISTTAAFVVAGTGITVAKHGNRSVSSNCGSADVLKALGVNIEANPSTVEKCLEKVGIGFLFAPLLHGAMKYAIGPRKEIGIRTVFNMLGPLTNPAGADAQVIGLYAGDLTEKVASVLKNLGTKHAFVVHGDDGLDEISLASRTKMSELKDGKVNTYWIEPEEFNMKRCSPEDLKGGSPEENARITCDVLNGKKGPKRDIVLLNAAAAIVAAGKAKDIAEGIRVASESIDSGASQKKLDELVEVSNAQ
ncbi:MAG: anthranilate phosphoribosyltransferase [Thermodesulfobacteriota bacterium]|nr:anthranilate phosphoribosyltransferase [Thermodesulfobacteriota bacterium]